MTEQRPRGTHDLSLNLLVLRCQAGDERAFASLMDAFGSKTLAYLRGVTGNDADADDVHQEVWLAVYRTLRTLAVPGAFRTWLYRTTRHRVVDYLRRRKRERELIDDDAPVEALPDEDAATERGEDVPEALVESALAAIPPPQREVLLLRFRDDLSYTEIATIVGVPLNTVRTRLHHAKRRLREHIERGRTQ